MTARRRKVELERGGPDRLVPKDFGEILARRFLPVLSLTYISVLIGIAAEKGSLIHYLFEDKSAYVMALMVAAWVSVPAIIWIIVNGSPIYNHLADIWYKIVAALMTMILISSFVLFPEAHVYGLRVYFAATLPVLFIMYIFFVKGGLPAFAAYPLTAMGLTALIHGAILNFIH
ncbi:MAG: hypothetical protein DYH13_10145 [Alphaproteobacteria bacterium PRO2]|nr:hypothetical protein [Alphaproteobacteria bacterium PRO2]